MAGGIMAVIQFLGSLTYGVMVAARKAGLLAICAIFLAGQVAAEKVHLIAFGDSLTAGWGLLDHEGYVPVLRGWMESQGEDVRIVQGGVSGETTSGGLARLEWALSEELQGIIIGLGGNDILRGVDPGVARDNLRKMLEICREKKLEVLLVGMPVAANYGAAYKAEFEAIWPDLAKEFGVAYYANFLAPIQNSAADPLSFMQEDGIHPNAEGVQRIVLGIGPDVQAMVARIRAK
ncbi:arylesterase [Alisedimentitalea sp. MJ-SS2]|uniref:arylesterase n=1 Tax=Aliisedimentitalea sp. MJ-SS2 TaxID=3049795 RepID=UPI00290D8B8F|nr:arylesterase [Alisedimentitalea sp. MJ-SS2]MDU8928953.1 arylesterase [Alisedimentitalea sp. MJ-SS2]